MAEPRIDCTFEPDGMRGRALDERMRRQLSDSLAYLAAALAEQQPGSVAAHRAADWQQIISALRSGNPRIAPAIFSAYFQLVIALTDEALDLSAALDDLDLAAQETLTARFRRFEGNAGISALYRRALDTDPDQPSVFRPPSAQAALAMQSSVRRALKLMRTGVPALADELDGLIGEIVLAAGADDPGALHFDGASSYQLWGALALNVDEPKTDLEMLEALAHEAGHSFLFGMTVHEPLVFNEDEERYPSPLRPDPRPMDGIYHATWVSARMHYAVLSMRDSGTLDAAQAAQAESLLCASRRAFSDGDAVVRAHGRLSATGAALLDDARRYMAESA